MTTVARWLVAVAAVAALSGCATGKVRFENLTPGKPLTIDGYLSRPAGEGPFPAVVLMHPCTGVGPQLHRWARWLVERGYVALVVDSFGPRGIVGDCRPETDKDKEELPNTARFDDSAGALRFLMAQPYVRPDRIGIMGFSQGGVFSMAAINGPTLDRARRRGVHPPTIGYRAAVGVYPGGCFSLVEERVIRPLLILMGEADDWTRAETCREMAAKMRAKGADVTMVTYPGAYHFFDVEDQKVEYLPHVANRNKPNECCGATVGYHPEAAADARKQVEAFFERHLKR
jgi:dienelactone hydrolase